ncbi:citrate lyase acyl carrier protein [Enterococcus durans]|uniref:Citrate lyase acyl carrier protein n=2 Tax=Enterococcus durans TaxID=53345 RepID=A0AB36SCA4_9ENTE|nr:citrate lyase acyl carrier protein [Enterococcus durans]EOT31307.1 citrate lyase acyl carrier protein [Enterococcus durans ATCC 6056]EOU15563.1 citrate lyase acyl carrier protein [Enterococcus durans ATCC 6056]PEH46686.1 citrate lyase acyl carrier protein [Enterococcus durans]
MEINKSAIAGTLESSDVQIMISPNTEGIEIDLDSQVIEQFGKQIKKVIYDTLAVYQIKNVKLKVVDKGALDCVIVARLKTAIHRSLGIQNQETPWEV